jgi:hypothetical protein
MVIGQLLVLKGIAAVLTFTPISDIKILAREFNEGGFSSDKTS